MIGLVVIDMQKWMFRYSERAAQVPSLVANISALMNAFAKHGFPIFNIQTIHKADRSSWSRLMHRYNSPCLIENTEDAQLVDGFRLTDRAHQITKTRNSAFLDTNFETQLRNTGVTDIVLAGVFIDGCVGLTAADAAQRGFDVTFIDDAIGHTEPSRRDAILTWLAEDYELKVQTTEVAINNMHRSR